ncbi:hypothetical protein LVJ94_38165 [Pendulispora rubella]|uniref:Knr4/Smi1-like domain-containing protein n=1 Tax=Pendulispora rubella TaxID=2741070 RepID=A0ABZ2KXC3_9BACT
MAKESKPLLDDDEVLKDVLSRWDAWLEGQPKALQRMLAPGAEHAQVSSAGQQLGITLPSALRILYRWRNGERRGGTIFDAVLRKEMEAAAYREEVGPIRFLSLANVTLFGLEDAVVESAGEAHRFGHYDRDQGGAPNAHFVPFMWIPEQPRALSLLEEDEEKAAEGPGDGDWVFAVDTHVQAVWFFEYANEELEGTFLQAPNLATFMNDVLQALMSGRAEVTLPRLSAREAAPRDVTKEAEILLSILVQKGVIALSEAEPVDAVRRRLEVRLARKPRKRMLDEVVAFFEEDGGIEETYEEPDVMRVIVEEVV